MSIALIKNLLCVNKSAKATLRQIEKCCRDIDFRAIHQCDDIDIDNYLEKKRDNKFNIIPKFTDITSLMNIFFSLFLNRL